MSKYVLLRSSLLLVAVLLAGLAQAQAPVRNDTLVQFYRDVRGPMCNPATPAVGMITALTPLTTPLFNVRGGGAATCPAILAPDGHQITLGEFKAANGRAGINCINTGTQSVIHFSGLVPKQLYTVWPFTVGVGGVFTGAGEIGDTRGATGGTAPSVNNFLSSDAGEGEIVRITPAENLSAFGSIGNCFLDGVFQLHLVYHLDEMTHGGLPGSRAPSLDTVE